MLTILQHRRGFVWFGTQDGLNRYDRHSFVVFRNDHSDGNSPSGNYIAALLEDNEGRLWIGIQTGGFDRLNQETASFTRLGKLVEDSIAHDKPIVSCLLGDREEHIWIGSLSGELVRFDPNMKSMHRYKNNTSDRTSLSHNSIWPLHQDHSGTLWAGTYDGVHRYDARTDRFTAMHSHSPGNLLTLL